MAQTHANWLNVGPTSGSGNGTTNHSASPNTGRNSRQTNVTFKAAGVANVLQLNIQAGKPEFVTIEDITVSKAGGNLVVSGISNSSKLSFSLGDGNIDTQLPDKFTVEGMTINIGTGGSGTITGDIGASAEYNFSIMLNIPANDTLDAKSKMIIVSDNAGNSASATITQAAGDPNLTVNSDTVYLSWQGEPAVAVTVSSNTNWTVE
jgi:hypothetical protein